MIDTEPRTQSRTVTAALSAGAVAMFLISGWLLDTLVLDESSLDWDRDGMIDTILFVSVPAMIGTFLGTIALCRALRR